MNVWKKVYGVCFFALCLCPSIGMFWAKTDNSSENRALTEIPKLRTEEEGWNLKWLSDLGDYFQDHFAYRQELVTANALIRGKGLGVSTVASVVQGKNDWLYYNDSVRDYLGSGVLSERSLYNIARSLKLTQDNLNRQDVKFLFTIAPNKNSLYGDNMPYYDSVKVTEDNNRRLLTPILAEQGVNYVDLYELFTSQDEILYHERDSHWNNKGAAMACEALLSALRKGHTSYLNESFTVKKDFEGDLDKMLYPEALTLEDEIYYDKDMTYTYVNEIKSTFDSKITTVNSGKEGSLVMYRDSFGNALLPFVADEYGKAYFSRGVPYQMNDVVNNQADTVLIERAERFLPDMAKNPPVLAAALLKLNFLTSDDQKTAAEDLKIEKQGLYWKVSGRMSEEYMNDFMNIYILIDGAQLYEAYPLDLMDGDKTDPYGFCLYVSVESLISENSNAEVYLSTKCSTGADYMIPEEITIIQEEEPVISIQEVEAVG